MMHRLFSACRVILMGVADAALAMLLVSACEAADTKMPNILLIVSEDNGRQFGCYGDHTAPTPNVDALAKQGVRFTNAYVTQAVCSPSRSTILTGLYPHQNGQLGLATSQYTMAREWPTLPGLLNAAGYRTGIIGKLHVLPESAFPFGYHGGGPKIVGFKNRDVQTTAKLAGEFIAADDQPFFLMLNYADAHLPFLQQSFGLPEKLVSPEQVKMFPAVGTDSPRLRQHLADYYDCISRLDTGIGLLLAELDRSGKADNTLVVYISDHGPQFSRGKTTAYELGLCIPMIVRWPGHTQAGQVRQELVSTIDLMPTLLAAAGAKAPKNLPGQALAPLLSGGAKPDWRQYLFCEWNSSHIAPNRTTLMFPQRTVRDDQYKLIQSLLPGPNESEKYYTEERLIDTGSTQAEIDAASDAVRAMYATWRNAPAIELYDLQHDPDELVNLAGRPELAKVQSRLLAALTKWRQETGDPFLDPRKLDQLLAENREHLKTATEQGKKPVLTWRYPQYLYGEK